MPWAVPSPAALAAGFAIGALAITALHLIRERRRRVVVGFAALWLRVAASRAAPRPKWRALLSWLLHVAMLALLVTAAGTPRTRRAEPSRRLVVILDVGATMQARDEPDGGSRIERARQEAARLFEGLGPGERAMVVAAGAQPIARGGFTSDAAALAEQANVAVEQGVADLARALSIAGAALEGAAQRGEIVIISDGAGAQAAIDRAGFAGAQHAGGVELAGATLRYLPVGAGSDDLGITAFAARRQPSHPADYEVLAEVRSFRDHASRAALELWLDGSLIETVPLELPAGATVTRRFADLAGEGQRLEARLVPLAGDPTPLDPFALDDRAYAVLPSRQRLRLLVCGAADDLFLEGALLANEEVAMERVAPAACDARLMARYDLVALDGMAPPVGLPVPALVINPVAAPGAAGSLALGAEVTAPMVMAEARRHPLLRFVDFTDVNFARARLLRPAAGDVPLLSTAGGVMALVRERPARMVVLGFDLRRTDLPLRPAFPILLANALHWLAAEQADFVPALRVGTPTAIEASGQAVILVAPDGTREPAPVREGQATVTARAVGFHTVEREGAAPLLLAANLDPRESDIRPSATLSVGGHNLAAPTRSPRRPRGELRWQELALAALALLFLEWWAFHRRVTA